jgi:hypothetical protein
VVHIVKEKAIASIGTGPHERLLRLAARSFRPFAERHGYDVHLGTRSLDPSRPVSWSKVVLLRELLERYEQVLWLDSDLVIVDPREDMPRPEFMGIVEHTTKEGRGPNAGVWSLIAGEEVQRFLAEVWAQEDLVTHKWWETAAICRLLGYDLEPLAPREQTRWLDKTTFIDPRWNSIPDAPAANPRVRHYPGYSVKTRAAFMLRDLVLRRR